MEIKTATFLMSNTQISACPGREIPEYAFIGRSNVGKSSLINMLTKQPKLAKISGKPGKTRLINHFLINDAWYLVDLPGYGYAKVSKTERAKFHKLINSYLLNRNQLYALFVLIDIRHEPQAIDLEFLEHLGISQVPFAIVFTKADKLKPAAIEESVARYRDKMLENWESFPKHLVSSATTELGRDEILRYIDELNILWREQNNS